MMLRNTKLNYKMHSKATVKVMDSAPWDLLSIMHGTRRNGTASCSY